MKILNVTIITVISAVLCSSLFAAENIQRNVYSAECGYSAPLDTFDRCDETSWIGRQVANCAYNQAIDNCNADLNFDCVEVSAQVWQEVSLEFIGFKQCKAKARVHGYGK